MTTGRVVAIDQTVAGVTVDGDHTESDNTITVMDCVDLEEGGGLLSLPSGEVVEYGPVDLQGTLVYLSEELPEDVEDSERLATFPPQVTTVAAVVIDEDGHAEPVPVEVPSGIAGWSSLAPGAMLTFRVTPNGTLLATDVTAGSLSVAADQVSAGTIRSEWRMSRDGAIVVGDDEVGSGEFTYDGLRFSKPGPLGPYENVIMTTEDTSFGVMGEDGTRLGGIGADGSVSGTSAAFGSLAVAGTSFLEWLDQLPRGVISGDERDTASALVGSTGVQYAFLHTSAYLLPGRRYRICGSVRARLHTSNAALSIFLRHREGTETPSITDPAVGVHSSYGTGVSNSANHRLVAYGEAFYTVDSPRMESFLITYRGDYGGTPQRDSGYIYVEDVGPDFADSGGAGDDDDEGNTVTYTTTWQATASRMYDRFGAAIPDSDGRVDLWYWHGDPVDYQQSAVLFGGGAVESTYTGELSKNLPTALGGADITKVEVYLRNKQWFGGGALAMSPLGEASLPSSKVIDSTHVLLHPEGAGVWRSVPVGWFGGINRGVCIGDKDGSASGINLASGSFHGINDDDPPLLRITYTR